MVEINTLNDKLKEYLPEGSLPFLQDGYQFALRSHEGQKRKSGEPYLEHPLQTALIVADLKLDTNCVVAALLHDVVEDCGVSLEEIEQRFGAEVAKLVDGVTKLGKLARPSKDGVVKSKKGSDNPQERIESLRKMFIAMAEDIRVVIIKLADRLHNMRTLKPLSPDKRRNIARETMDIYAPLAHRLGIWQLEWELEDLSLRYLEPAKYKEVTQLVAARREEREQYISQVIRILSDELKKAGITAEVYGRPKNIYGVYTKIQKYAEDGKEFSDIYDLLAVRVLVDEIKDCYNALGAIHSLWRPIPGQFDDYIANPKDNMYQSLHTTVMALDTKPLEIQVRTYEMHRLSEYGIAAHWRYKEGAKGDMRFDEKVAWLRQLMDWQRELSIPDFLEMVKTDMFGDQVFVYTPQGEIKQMPSSSTPLDFAYRIHTELGHHCIGAKVNGKLVSLTYQLRNGDTVEILSTRADRGPSLDWLNPNSGYVNSSHARARIKQWFKRQEKATNIDTGKALLEKEFRRLGIPLSEQKQIALLFKYDDMDDFLAALGCGEVSTHQIAVKLSSPQETDEAPPKVVGPPAEVESAIQVMGVGDLLTHVAKCCNPVPGDEIIGYITRTRGITVHRRDCPNVLNEDEKERLVKVEWGHVGQAYPVSVQVEANDRVGLLRDITTLVSEEKVNIAAVSSVDYDDGVTVIYLTLHITDIKQLSRLLSKLDRIVGVLSVARSGEGAKRES
ncbi:RelA/SpoT family protein [Chloroflexota bacterium]